MPRVLSSRASASTIRQRSKQLASHRSSLSGGDSESTSDLAREIQVASKQKRQALMKILREDEVIKVQISPQESLAIKANLQISWNKVRALRR